MDSKSIENLSDESDIDSRKAKIDFKDYATQPNLVARVTRLKKVDEEKNSSDEQTSSQRASKRNLKQESKLGKRQSSAISVFPARNGKMAKYGAAVASVFAVSVALFGNQKEVLQDNNSEMTFGHGLGGRSLLSIPEENQIELSDSNEQDQVHSWSLYDPETFEDQVKDIQLYEQKHEMSINLRSQGPAIIQSIQQDKPCNTLSTKEFLEQTYMLESLRDDYLDKLCPDENAIGSEENFPPVIYQPGQSQKQELTPSEVTTTLFAANPQMILPTDQEGNIKNWDLNFSRNVGADSYLHIVLPAKDINILNPGSTYQEDQNPVSGSENMYVEIGCKVFSINHIQYTQEI